MCDPCSPAENCPTDVDSSPGGPPLHRYFALDVIIDLRLGSHGCDVEYNVDAFLLELRYLLRF